MIPAMPPHDDVCEADLARQGVELSTTLGWKRYHTYRSTRSPSGFPDEVFVRERVVYVEWKTEAGKVSEAQKEWLRALLVAGAEAYLIRPRNLQALAEILAYRGQPWLTDGPVAVTAAGLREEFRKEVAA